MARLARIVVPGVPHHITQCGNRRQPVFFKNDDYLNYLKLMAEWCNSHQVSIWAYCLMPNHIHLIAVPETKNSLSHAVGEAHRRYTRMINFRENWRGYLWQGRFVSYPLDEKYLLTAVRYIELNPVRSGLAKNAWTYQWSSASAHIKGNDDILVQVQPMLDIVSDWQDFISNDVSNEDLTLLRKHSRTCRPLGSEEFISHLEIKLNRILRPKKPGPKKTDSVNLDNNIIQLTHS
jgi:putative transposase